jgi:hypothetical protein
MAKDIWIKPEMIVPEGVTKVTVSVGWRGQRVEKSLDVEPGDTVEIGLAGDAPLLVTAINGRKLP